MRFSHSYFGQCELTIFPIVFIVVHNTKLKLKVFGFCSITLIRNRFVDDAFFAFDFVLCKRALIPIVLFVVLSIRNIKSHFSQYSSQISQTDRTSILCQNNLTCCTTGLVCWFGTLTATQHTQYTGWIHHVLLPSIESQNPPTSWNSARVFYVKIFHPNLNSFTYQVKGTFCFWCSLFPKLQTGWAHFTLINIPVKSKPLSIHPVKWESQCCTSTPIESEVKSFASTVCCEK